MLHRVDDVTAIDAEPLPCPLCAYDLRATTAGRCPECGHAFDAAELRQRLATRAQLAWFVEVDLPQWWSGWSTSLATLRPVWFWRNVTPELPMRPSPRTLFAAGSILVPSVLVPMAWSLWADMQNWWWGGWIGNWNPWIVPLVLGGMLLLTVAVSAVFQQTLRRAGIRRGHLWRVAVYGCDFRLLWLPAVLLVILLVTCASSLFGGNLFLGYNVRLATVQFALLAWIAATIRVVAAYLHYLRLPAALATALLVQATVGLALFVGIVLLSNPPW